MKEEKDQKAQKASKKKEGKKEGKGSKKTPSPSFEVWASDQSNSVPGQESLGVKGSFLWIFDSQGVMDQLAGKSDATPLSCTPENANGPCDAFDVFPQELAQIGTDGPTGETLMDLPGFGRLHGKIVDPQNLYVNANFFTPGGAYIGIIDIETKEAVSLFRLSKFETSKKRSVHMSIWLKDGSAILCSNLHGKAIERINITRDASGKITAAEFDKSGTFGLGNSNVVVEEATFFEGMSAFGRPLLGGIVGDYSEDALGELTPNGYCKEDGCTTSLLPPTGRVNNVPICPIPSGVPSTEDNLYVTLGGGGLLVLDAKATPMTIVGEYDSTTINGAGCGGTQAGQQIFLNAGVSAGASGSDQSSFTLYSLDDGAFSSGSNGMNDPPPTVVFKDPTNTNTIGNVDGTDVMNDTGQLPGVTTRRDAHGMISVRDQKFIHQFDRIRNLVEVFDAETYEHFSYDLTSKNGKNDRPDNPKKAGPCHAKSVTDDPNLIPNDPTPDLLGKTPDGNYLVVGFRGPAPVSVSHSGQGSCPGVGIIKLSKDGKRGKLVDVIRTTNTIDTADVPDIVNGIQYAGVERSDIHSAIVVSKGAAIDV